MAKKFPIGMKTAALAVAAVSACLVFHLAADGEDADAPLRRVPADIRDPSAPKMGKHVSFVLSKGKKDFLPELSGLCLSKKGDFLWGAGDDGALYKIKPDGRYERHFTRDCDMEGLALDPKKGDLYFASEPAKVYAMRPPYKKAERLFKLEDAAGMGNSGLEGLAWADGTLYLGAQTRATLWHCSLSGEVLWKKSLRDIVPEISEIAGLCCEMDRDRLWVVDSNSNRKRPKYLPFRLYLFDAKATRLLASYPLHEFAHVNPEAVCVDRKRGCIWIGEDCGDEKPSILHKVEFTGL